MMARFQYLKGDSFFHKMDPTCKFIWNFVVVATIFMNFAMPYSVTWYVYVAILAIIVAKITPKQYARSQLAFLGLVLFVAFWKTVYYVPEEGEVVRVLFTWGPINMTQEGMLEGFSQMWRSLVIIGLSIIFTMTTDPGRLVDSLIQVARVPYRIGFTAYAAMRFIPIYQYEAQVILNAHQIRGVGDEGKSFTSRLKLYRSMLVPLLVSGIRRAQAASIAMDSRAFGAYDKRTQIRKATVSRSDIAFVLVHVGIAVAAFYYFIILGRGIQYLG
jgi:energy-coupling factor transport system permease protein